MLYRTLRDTKLVLMLALGLSFGSCPAIAQDAAWEGLINAGRTALQQDKFSDAERYFEQALETAEKFQPGDPRLGRSLNNLAAVYYKQKDYDRAEPLMRRSLGVLEEALGPRNSDVAQTKKNLAAIYYLQGNYTDAEPLLQQSLSILEELHGPNHAFVATVLNNLAALYQTQNRFADAEPLLARSLQIWETLLGKDHQDVIQSRELLAKLRETNEQSADQPASQQIAEATSEPDAEAETPSSLEPTAAAQILALANEAEAAVAELPADASDAAVRPDDDPKANSGRSDIDKAAHALAKLSASETAAANRRQAATAGQPRNALPTPTVRTAALSTPEEADDASGPPSFAVYLSTLWSKDEAKRYWQSLKQELPEILADKEMELEEIVVANGGGTLFRVLTSPFPSDPAAQEACDEIRSQVRTHDCNVVAR
ncbi:MAG: tetratricopeptide repeat protein [Geminicoccaceae bacterium]